MAAADLRPAAGTDRTVVLVVAITLLALVLRVVYFLGSEVESVLPGDIREYWRYAWNLVHHGVFSVSPPADAAPAPDAWRGPGYPAFLAACLWLQGDAAQAVALAQWMQLLIGTALAPLTIALGRHLLAPAWALAAGLAVAVWPHLVVFSTTLLSETLFGFALLLAALAMAQAQARDSAPLAALAGLVMGLVALVNPLVALFPLAIAAVLAVRRQARCAAAFLVAFALVSGAWAWRNAGIETTSGSAQRLQTNLVQGSWPLFLQALNDRSRHPVANAYFQQVEEQTRLMHADPRAALDAMAARMRNQPGEYLRWYVFDKPAMLWGWNVRVGWGDIYFLKTLRSPFETQLPLRLLRAACLVLNPVVALLALWATLAALWCAVRRRWPVGAELAAPRFAELYAALFLVYVTAVHAVLQGEPRYAIAYRPFEFLLAASAVAMLVGWLRQRRGLPA